MEAVRFSEIITSLTTECHNPEDHSTINTHVLKVLRSYDVTPLIAAWLTCWPPYSYVLHNWAIYRPPFLVCFASFSSMKFQQLAHHWIAWFFYSLHISVFLHFKKVT